MNRWIPLLSALSSAGCLVHHHAPANAPGHVTLEEPPADPEVPEAPRDPGEEVTVVSAVATPLGVGWTSFGTADARTYMPFSLELAFSRHTLRESHARWVAPLVLDGALRPNVGMTFLRVYPGSGDKADVGPTFLELQYVGVDKDKFWTGTFAAGVATTFHRVGPQVTGCIGTLLLFDVCARGSWLFQEGASVQLGFGYQGALEWIASR